MKLNRYLFSFLFGLLVPLVAVSVGATDQPRPNIVLFLIDDLGWKDCGFMGNPYVHTPHIDRLSREGMIFTSAYSNGPNCAPSRACLMSGQYGPRHGIYTVGRSDRGAQEQQALVPETNRTILDESFYTLAEALRAQGYITAHIGKWHLGEDPGSGPNCQGFDINIGGDKNGKPPQGYFPPYGLTNLDAGEPGEYLTDRLTQEVVTFLASKRRNPFFLYLSHYAVHTPIQAPEVEIQAYREKFPGRSSLDATYAAMIESVDRSVGRITTELDHLGLAGNTIVLLLSDNGGVYGTSLMEPLRGGKGMLYEGGIRVPFVVRWPGRVRPGGTNPEPVTGLDLYPTLMEIAGVEPPTGLKLDGKSLVPLLEERPGFSRPAVFWHFPAYLPRSLPGKDLAGARDVWFRTRPCSAVRAGDWKLIEYFEDGVLELYNLREDIGEKNNLVTTKPEIKDRLLRLMRNWRQQTGAAVPATRNPNYQPTEE